MPPLSSASYGGNERTKYDEYLARMNVLWKEHVAKDPKGLWRYTQETTCKMPTKGGTEKEQKDFIAREGKDIHQHPISARWYKDGKSKRKEEEREILTIQNTVENFHAAYTRDKGWRAKKDFTRNLPRTREGISRRDVEFLIKAHETVEWELENWGLATDGSPSSDPALPNTAADSTITKPFLSQPQSSNVARSSAVATPPVAQTLPPKSIQKSASQPSAPPVGTESARTTVKTAAPLSVKRASKSAEATEPDSGARGAIIGEFGIEWTGCAGGRYRPKTQDEKDARWGYCRDRGLCFYCESTEHDVAECPEPAKLQAKKQAAKLARETAISPVPDKDVLDMERVIRGWPSHKQNQLLDRLSDLVLKSRSRQVQHGGNPKDPQVSETTAGVDSTMKSKPKGQKKPSNASNLGGGESSSSTHRNPNRPLEVDEGRGDHPEPKRQKLAGSFQSVAPTQPEQPTQPTNIRPSNPTTSKCSGASASARTSQIAQSAPSVSTAPRTDSQRQISELLDGFEERYNNKVFWQNGVYTGYTREEWRNIISSS